MSNPWADEHGSQCTYKTSVGGIAAFVRRQNLEDGTELCDTFVEPGDSKGTTAQLCCLMQQRRELFEKRCLVESLESIHDAVDVTTPETIEHRRSVAQNFQSNLQGIVKLESSVLRILQAAFTQNSISLEFEHQRDFLNMFQMIKTDLPRQTELLEIQDAWMDLKRRQELYCSVVQTLRDATQRNQAVLETLVEVADIYAKCT